MSLLILSPTTYWDAMGYYIFTGYVTNKHVSLSEDRYTPDSLPSNKRENDETHVYGYRISMIIAYPNMVMS